MPESTMHDIDDLRVLGEQGWEQGDLETHLNVAHDHRVIDLMALSHTEQNAVHVSDHDEMTESENQMLRTLIKALCSDPGPFGSESFNRVRDTMNPEHRALLLDVLSNG